LGTNRDLFFRASRPISDKTQILTSHLFIITVCIKQKTSSYTSWVRMPPLQMRELYCLPQKVKVTLQPTVSQPVHLGVRHPSGTRDQFFFLLESIYIETSVCNVLVCTSYTTCFGPYWYVTTNLKAVTVYVNGSVASVRGGTQK
jgi:hypothetical protein